MSQNTSGPPGNLRGHYYPRDPLLNEPAGSVAPWVAAALDDITRRLARLEARPPFSPNTFPLPYMGLPPGVQPNLQNVVQYPPAPQWRPISEAPKDGTRLLLFMPHLASNPIHIGHWGDDTSAGWRAGTRGVLGCVAPSHWMPLPAPPKFEP